MRKPSSGSNYALYRTGHDKVASPWALCPVDKRERYTSWRVFLAACPILFVSPAFGAEASCKAPTEILGTYKTEASLGYTPNVLVLSKSGASILASLRSYWAPVPNDDGRLGTIGDFSGRVSLSKPWTCAARFEHQEPDAQKGTHSGCTIVMICMGSTHVKVRSNGECELYHGHGAYPDGTYVKTKTP
jgi:hypothetical protein